MERTQRWWPTQGAKKATQDDEKDHQAHDQTPNKRAYAEHQESKL